MVSFSVIDNLKGLFDGKKVVIKSPEDANRLYNRGYFGTPLSGGGLEISLYEACFLSETDRLEIVDDDGVPINHTHLIEKYLAEDEMASVKYPLYRDMRRRGYVLKKSSTPSDFRVFPRGGGPGITPSKYWLIGRAETNEFSFENFYEIAKKIEKLRKNVMIGILDEEGDVTYYKISTIDLKGESDDFGFEKDIKGVLYGDRTYVKSGSVLHRKRFYGRILNDDMQLSLLESVYLLEKEIISVEKGNSDRSFSVEELIDYGIDLQRNFLIRLKIYRDLRDRGLIPKTGFKYGTAFRCYKGKPDHHHAEYLIQPVPMGYRCSWYYVSRAVRVAHSVRKKFVFGSLSNDGVCYLKIGRLTP